MVDADWLASAEGLLESYFTLEDPRSIEPEAVELRVDHTHESGLAFGGVIDRLDVAPDGRIRVVDFKTGRSPNERFEDKSLFQMKFYALVIWRTRGVIPTVLQLYYLADRTVLSYEPSEAELLATERKVVAVWDAIRRAIEREEFVARKSALCQWCRHQDKCPEFGGTAPSMPKVELVQVSNSTDSPGSIQ